MLSRWVLFGAAIMLCGVSQSPRASAASTLDRIRAENMLRCGAGERPGIATVVADGKIIGLAVDLCRAAALAALGPRAQIDFTLLESDRDYDASASLDLVFLTGADIADHGLAAKLIPGPTVFVEQTALMVPVSSPSKAPADLAGAAICFISGGDAHRALESTFERLNKSFVRMPFQEDVEMIDAYNVGRCQAIASEVTDLARIRHNSGINRLQSRVLTPAVAVSPIIALTGTGDGQFTALAFWTLNALMQAPGDAKWQPTEEAAADGLTRFGISPSWRVDLAPLGSYDDMLRRDLGDRSGLGIEPGPNSAWPDGVRLPPSMD